MVVLLLCSQAHVSHPINKLKCLHTGDDMSLGMGLTVSSLIPIPSSAILYEHEVWEWG